MTGILLLGVAVVLATAFGLFRRVVDGRFGPQESRLTEEGADVDTTAADPTLARLQDAMPGLVLGDRATLVQFSSAFCAPCRTTRVVLDDVAARETGVRHLEVDAEKHLDLVRALDVRRTPTTLVLDHAGREVARAAGAPQRAQVLAVLPVGGA